MSLTDLNKTIVTLVKLKLDYCENTFNNAPCSFSQGSVPSSKCYNTFATCLNNSAFKKGTKEYKFVNYDTPVTLASARPYLLSVDHAPTKIKEDRTVSARATLTFRDERDYDVGIDKYLKDRNPGNLSAPGYFFKKLISRNPNYKGRIVEIWEGTSELLESEYKLKDTLQIENITLNGDQVRIECVDLLKRLDEVQYPVQIDSKLEADLGALYEVKSEEEMLKLSVETGDYALRVDFAPIKGLTPLRIVTGGGQLTEGIYKYTVVAYKGNDPVARGSTTIHELNIATEGTYNAIKLIWEPFTQSADYIVFWEYDGGDGIIKGSNSLSGTEFFHKVQPSSTTQEIDPPDDPPPPENQVTYSAPSGVVGVLYSRSEASPNDGGGGNEVPPKADRLFKFTGGDPIHLENWSEVTGQVIELKVSNLGNLNDSGYLQINKEIVQYYVSQARFFIIKRNLFGSKASRHYIHTNVNKVYQKYPTNPDKLLREMLKDAGIADEHVDDSAFDTLGWDGIQFSTKPITKQTKLSKLYFDLINVMDAQSWRNEEGKITIRVHKDEDAEHTITDAENIILNSTSMDINEEERITQVSLYWDREDLTKSLTDIDNYSRININVEPGLESENKYGERSKKQITTTWINTDYGQSYDGELEAYINKILDSKLKRHRDARPELTFDVEAKDSSIKLGSIVELETDEFNDVNGNNFSGQKFQIIKKENKGNRATLTAKLYQDYETAFIPDQKDSSKGGFNDQPIIIENIDKEIEVFGLQFQIPSGVWYGKINDDILDINDRIKLRWDNMFKADKKDVKLIDGTPGVLDSIELWKKVKQYKVYMFSANPDSINKKSENEYPDINDANGSWRLIGTLLDTKEEDTNYKYEFSYTFPLQLIGSFLGFYVTVTTTLQTKTTIREVAI